MIVGHTNEQRFMASCIRRAFGSQATIPLDVSLDWDQLGEQAVRQGLGPLVYAGLAGTDVAIPPPVRAQLRAANAVSALQHKLWIEPALRLALETLDMAGARPVVLKGAALAALAYPQRAYRTLADIDLLIPAGHLEQACRALVESGFQPIGEVLPSDHHHLQPYRAPDSEVSIELHKDLLPAPHPYRIDVGALTMRAEIRELAVNVRARVLAPVDALLHVCIHLAFGHRYDWFPLRTLVDVLAITRGWKSSEWLKLVSSVKEARASGAVYWPLRLSKSWLEVPIPDWVLGELSPHAISYRVLQPVMESQYVLAGQAPGEWGAGVLYNTIRELSLHSGCSGGQQVAGIARSLFPAPGRVGHLPTEFTRSRLRYGVYLSRPVRLARGALAMVRLLTDSQASLPRQRPEARGSQPTRGSEGAPLRRRHMFATSSATTGDEAVPEYSPGPRPLMTLSVVIPALNEEDGIAAIVERIDATRPGLAAVGVDGLEIIVVDDGSHDRTPDIAASHSSVRLIRHPTNKGYGAAIKTGFNAASGQLLAFTDADGTYPPERFPELCRVALVHGADVVVGSRRSGETSEMPRVRRIGNFIWSNLVSIIGNRRVADPASGMRVLRASALRQLYPLPDGLNFTPVMSTRCVHENLKVLEVAIPYKERLGRSKLSVVRDGSRFLKTILWTSMEYNPVRVLGLIGVSALGLAGAIGTALIWLRLQGVTQLEQFGAFSVFAALVLGVAGVSIFSLGATFNYLVSLFQGRPVRRGLFGRPIFEPLLDRHFGWLGLLSAAAGGTLATASLALSVWATWDIARLWLWLLLSALLILVGLQLVISWTVMRVLETLSIRQLRIEEDMQPNSRRTPGPPIASGPIVAGVPSSKSLV